MRHLALAAALLATLVAPAARADLIFFEVKPVPLELTFEGEVGPEAEIVVDCMLRGTFRPPAFAAIDAPLACEATEAPNVFAVSKKQAAELRALPDRNLKLWEIYKETKKVLEKAAKCGTIAEWAPLDEKSGVTKFVGRYALDRNAAGKCSMRKVSWGPVRGAAGAASSASASASAQAPAPTSDKAAPSSRSGGCGAAPLGAGVASALSLVATLWALARRRARRVRSYDLS